MSATAVCWLVVAFVFNRLSGINRVGFSDADFAARQWLMAEMKASNLTDVRMDGVGNVIGRFGPADGPVVMCGSHLDSVPEGRYACGGNDLRNGDTCVTAL